MGNAEQFRSVKGDAWDLDVLRATGVVPVEGKRCSLSSELPVGELCHQPLLNVHSAGIRLNNKHWATQN